MRSTDVNDIMVAGRAFINTKEWENDETRKFYYTGHEKVEKVSQRTGKKYTTYYVYLLQILESGEVCGEETLNVFPSQAQTLKTSGVKEYQEVWITPRLNDRGYQEWIFEAGKDILAEDKRPYSVDYVEAPKTTADLQKASGNLIEIDPDSIPF